MIIRSVNANSIISKYKSNQKTRAKAVSSNNPASSKVLSSEARFDKRSVSDKKSASYKNKIEQHIIHYRSHKNIIE